MPYTQSLDEVRIKHSNSKPIPKDWEAVIAPYLKSLRANGYLSSTIETRRQHLHYLARTIQTGPHELDAERLLEWCGEQVWALESRRGRYNTFRQFWQWANAREILIDLSTALPLIRQTFAAAQPAPYDVYFSALINADTRTRFILRLAGECGLRRTEISLVHVGRDVTPDPVVPGEFTLIVHGKGSKLRQVPLPRRLALEILEQGDGWLFTGAIDGHISRVWVGRLAARVLQDHWTLHSLRKRFATDAWQVDRDLFALQELLGHASPETTKRYVGTEASQLRNLVEGGMRHRIDMRASSSVSARTEEQAIVPAQNAATDLMLF